MDLFMQKWVQDSTTSNIASCYFCGNIGVVYLGVKPAEIIHISTEKLE